MAEKIVTPLDMVEGRFEDLEGSLSLVELQVRFAQDALEFGGLAEAKRHIATALAEITEARKRVGQAMEQTRRDVEWERSLITKAFAE